MSKAIEFIQSCRSCDGVIGLNNEALIAIVSQGHINMNYQTIKISKL